MEDSFQNYKYDKDSKKSEGIGNIGNNNENNKIDISKLFDPNRNYYNSIKENNLNLGKFSKNNSINLDYQNTIPNIYSIPFQAPRINEPQNFNTSISPLFNANPNFNQNQMFFPNNNYAPSNYLNQSQNIFPNYFPQFNNSNSNTINLSYQELLKRLMEKDEYIQYLQNKSSDNYQIKYYYEEKQGDEAKYRERIISIYKTNLKNANDALKNNQKIVFGSKEILEKKEIIIYIIDTNIVDIAFIKKLNEIKAVIFNDIKIPEITYEMIEQKIENEKYEKTEEDNIQVLGDYENNFNQNYQIYFNKYMFYSRNKISLFTPHIIRTTKNLTSLFFSEKLNLSDFQYNDYHKNINNDVFLQLLSLRINEFNDYEKKDGIITDKKYNEKIFGFNQNKSKRNYYLYSTMEKDIISKKLTKINITNLYEELTGKESQIGISNKPKTYNHYETFIKNMNFLKCLTYEELVLYIILNKIDKDQYEIFPKILFYEYYLTLNGEKVVVSNKIEPGYLEADFVFYSKCDVPYEEEPLILQKSYRYYECLGMNGNFKIKKDTLYFIELKSSFNFSEEKDKEKRVSKYEDFFKKLFNKYKEFINLYESQKWIEKNTKKEILLIYDNDIIDISLDIENIITNLLKENQNCIFRIIYTLKSYPYFSHSLAIEKHNKLEQKYEKLLKETKKREEESKKREEEMAKKIEKILQENKEIKESLINNNKINSELSNLGKNNNETKKDEN